MAGLRQTLNDAGFDVTDIVLKKNWGQPGGTKPAADTREESLLNRLEAEARSTRAKLTSAVAEVRVFGQIRDLLKELKTRPWANRRAFYEQLFRGPLSESDEPELLAALDKRAQRE